MNFLRKKLKRDAAVPTAANDVESVDKSKRRSYFMMRTSSSPMLGRRDTIVVPPQPAVLADTAASAKVVAIADNDSVSRIQRRRSIPGVAYLMAASRSIASKGATDDISTDAGLSVPERAVVHPGSLHAVAPRANKSDEHVAAGCMPERRASDCSSTVSSSSSNRSSGDDNNSDGSGGDSDDTLAPADAENSILPDVVTPAGGDGSIASSTSSYYSCSVVPPPLTQVPTETNAQIIESQPVSGESSPTESQPAAERQQSQNPQRRQLRLGRWRTASTCLAPLGDNDNGIGKLAALAIRPARLSLGSAPSQQQLQLRGLCDESEQSVAAGSKKVHRLLSSLGHQSHASLGLNGSEAQQRPHVAHRKLSGALGKLLLTPPPPSAAEQAKMDAWTADDDEFSANDYDLSGTYFELVPTSKQVVADEVPMLGSGRRKHSVGECTTPESRLSSTSTVVDEGAAALGPEQYKRIFVSSARKLQLQCGRRGMSCVVHIKTMMTKASEHYVVVSGGRNLDAYRISREVLAELCLSASAEDSVKERLPLVMTQQRQHSTAYPTRKRSVGGAQQAQRRSRRAAPEAECGSRPAVAVETLSSVVEVPLSSPPPLSPSAEIADAAMAKIATEAEAAVLAEYGMGDLVSLGPTTSTSSDDDEAHNSRPTYRRYRRRRASKWGYSGVAGAIAAL
ncbi:hypothetical protein IWW38_001720 [Coemansia aciculifera]|uniref:Uncharacterized protein n=1 Tax=Coemansia aciculifera TaxID=417176 RepID=A0ACC1M6E2_9FUNG|nr:hypothetical protein IWW38_001720 [Coemansia aciculifera]